KTWHGSHFAFCSRSVRSFDIDKKFALNANGDIPFDIHEKSCLEWKLWFANHRGITLTLSHRRTTMLFLGIDQHARQLTVSLRHQQGDVLLARHVKLWVYQ
ncbi:hypothetical protein, partial [uncultured Rubinisphaera sp.]|uniref:hypothetical protein n=1 Tax=uncultured Rubinisphaera sp. TaxID=1678686 RepID=UPI0030DB722C